MTLRRRFRRPARATGLLVHSEPETDLPGSETAAAQTIRRLARKDSPSPAPWAPHGLAQAARSDDGSEGRSSRQARRPLLFVPPLARPDRELGEWPDHAVLPDLRREAGYRRQAE